MAMSGLMNSSPDEVRRVHCWFPIPPVMAAAIWPFTMLGPGRGSACGASDRVQTFSCLRAVRRYGEGPRIGSGPDQGSDIFQNVDVVDTVMGVDSEAHARHARMGMFFKAVERGETGHVFFWSADPCLVTAHQEVGAPVHQDDGVQSELSASVW